MKIFIVGIFQIIKNTSYITAICDVLFEVKNILLHTFEV